MSSDTGTVAPQRASDQAYDLLLERILDLRLPPGAMVNEQQIATEIGFGRMPVREAIPDLRGTGSSRSCLGAATLSRR